MSDQPIDRLDILDNPQGHELVRKHLRPLYPHDLHDYIVEGIAKAVDGTHVLSVVKTGGGKSSYFLGYILLLLALLKDPSYKKRLPKDPLMIVVYPTKGLEEEQEEKFKALGIRALAINKDRLCEAQVNGRDLWKEALSTSMLLISPELLVSPPFDHLLHTPVFRKRICALGIDEMHLIQQWGAAGFRIQFLQIGLALARMPPTTVLIGVTATLLLADADILARTLGLAPGSFFFSRRTNIRPEVRIEFRTLTHGLGGKSFPDLRWIIRGHRKTIIFCDSISLAYRVFVYLVKSMPSKRTRRNRIRLYTSLFSSSGYYRTSRKLFVTDNRLQVLVATDALKVGIDFPNVDDVILLNNLDPSDQLQMIGRAGRSKMVKEPRGIVYLTKTVMDQAQKWKKERDEAKNGTTAVLKGLGGKRSDSGSKSREALTDEMASIIVAECVTEGYNVVFCNPSHDTPCLCESCKDSIPPSVCLCYMCQPRPETTNADTETGKGQLIKP